MAIRGGKDVKHIRRGFALLLCTSIPGGVCLAQDVNVRRVTEHITVLNMENMGSNTNVTVIAGEKGLAVIETEISPYVMGKIKEAAEKALGRSDWAYVINTHNHLHHAGGNAAFEGVPVIGHESMNLDWLENRLSTAEGREQYCQIVGVRQGLSRLRGLLVQNPPLAQGQELRRRIAFMEEVEREILAGFDVVNPTITFEDRYRLDLGDVHLELIYWGDAICHSSIFAHVIEDNVLVGMGMHGTWVPDFYGQLSLDGIRRAIGLMEEFRKADRHIRLMIGVHGAEFTTTTEYFKPRQEYLTDLLNGLTLARQRGLSLEQVKREFAFGWRYARFRKDFPDPPNIEEVHQASIEKIWKLLAKKPS
jgi:glyoxylase-like metal-dependent hydrolase (beta-lactamase superfamily II)